MHRSMSTVHAANICMWLKRDLRYDPVSEELVGTAEANRLRTRGKQILDLLGAGSPPWNRRTPMGRTTLRPACLGLVGLLCRRWRNGLRTETSPPRRVGKPS